jgi:hypothetical protein
MTDLEKLEKVEGLLNEWLVDHTIDVFDERPEIDESRTIVQDAMSESDFATLEQAESLLHSWLLWNTVSDFDEDPEINQAYILLKEVIAEHEASPA